MLTVLSSFEQEESKNISDNVKWSARKKFEQGEVIINTTRFLGYDKDKHGDLVINQEEAEVVKKIFSKYLEGKVICGHCGSSIVRKAWNVQPSELIETLFKL
ncbi:MAG: hypothetical protein ABRQ27_01870 [Clostridiaceae bacterium]